MPFLIFIPFFLFILSCSHATYHDRENQNNNANLLTGSEFTELKKKVTLFRFWNDTAMPLLHLEETVTEDFIDGLIYTNKTTVPTNNDLKTQDFVKNNTIYTDQLLRVSKKTGSSAIIIGKISQLKFSKQNEEKGFFAENTLKCSITLEIKIFETQHGQEILTLIQNGFSERTAYTNKDDPKQQLDTARIAAQNAIQKMLPLLEGPLNKLSWKGQIAEIQGNIIYINAGRYSGLVLGDILRVLSAGQDIYDQSTGNLIGSTIGRMKGTLEVIDFLGTDAAATRIHSGGNFEKNDTVMLY